MKITLESTSKIVEVNGVHARIWVGRSEAGTEIHAFIVRVAVSRESDSTELKRELLEQRSPRPADPQIAAYPTRLIL